MPPARMVATIDHPDDDGLKLCVCVPLLLQLAVSAIARNVRHIAPVSRNGDRPDIQTLLVG